jgi:hypothetical protein
MVSAWFPVFLVIIGLIGYFASSNPKVARVAEIAIAAGLFAIAFALAGKLITLP